MIVKGCWVQPGRSVGSDLGSDTSCPFGPGPGKCRISALGTDPWGMVFIFELSFLVLCFYECAII